MKSQLSTESMKEDGVVKKKYMLKATVLEGLGLLMSSQKYSLLGDLDIDIS